ncbi:MAG TPA: 3-ketoacyl-ACP reductase [Phycisphaerales bacterium]|nr:3-ketoacyl-ACP reductase [Phycisphaerales bacterium]HCD34150.1 3-ketoacyl-ACP reductase [Phycisphaerales bacterium]
MHADHQKVAIVTGASRGIGQAIALRLAADGFAVVVNYAKRLDAAQDVVSQIKQAGGKATAIQADVSDVDAVGNMFDETQAAFGGIDVLVNNAGILKNANVTDLDDETIDSVIAINLKGSINTMRQAARRLRDGGRIINITSSVIAMSLPTYGLYAASKAAIEAMTPVLAKELRGRNITVNSVAPGPTATELFMEGKPQTFVDHLANLSPLERLGQPQDIANAVAFLAGSDGAWINGQTLRTNGGVI